MARRLLVTGATGGLGAALVRAARARGHDVVATGRSVDKARALEALGARFVPADLAEARDLAPLVTSVVSVIHAAALSASWGPKEAFVRANVTATARLLDAARAAACRHFVFISSPSIFASFRDRENIGIDAAPADPPLNDYARTKLAAERMVLAADSADMACCAIRPRALVGPGDRVILPKLAELAMRRRMPLPGGGHARVEFTDLRDAADAILLAEDRAPDIGGIAINISGGRPVAVRDVAERLAAVLGTDPELVALPVRLARIIAVVAEGWGRLTRSAAEPVLTRYTLATLACSQSFDMTPAERLLGFRPRHDALATLLAEAAQWKAKR
ncbi:NAD-dependent epimerase/dehydratase family protein [Sphingopyxis sp. J-6]|uniref:NAD-dependent epimerase/dehydratase family protein n=1 Tax=Sphingopyxis sp. J-6 TaxID=3122054 RepID=UPI0039840FBB